MKEKPESLHGEVKSLRKAAEDRLEDVFFTHPEYRNLKTAAAVDWMICRVRELNYPFSSKKEPLVSIWHQVLSEKREEMIAGIKDEKPKIKIESKVEFDPAHIKQIMKERGITNLQAAKATGISCSSLWMYRTGKNLKSKIVTPGVRKLLMYLESQPIKEPKIKEKDKTEGRGIAAKSQGDEQGNPRLGVGRKLQANPLVSDSARAYEELKKKTAPGKEIFSKSTLEAMRDLIDASIGKGKIVADASIVIKEGKFFIEFSIDITQMLRMYIRQHGKVTPSTAIDGLDQIKITFS